MAKVYDYEQILYALTAASQEWERQGRVTRKTYLRLRGLMSQAVVNRMTGQLLDYQNPMSTLKPVDSVLDLPAWRKAYAWARKQDEPRRQAELKKLGQPSLSQLIGSITPENAEASLAAKGLDPEQYRVETRAHARMRAAGL